MAYFWFDSDLATNRRTELTAFSKVVPMWEIIYMIRNTTWKFDTSLSADEVRIPYNFNKLIDFLLDQRNHDELQKVSKINSVSGSTKFTTHQRNLLLFFLHKTCS